MKYTNLGRTGLKVSRLALGTMNFSPKTSEDESHAILDRAIEMGLNLVDTADIYGYRQAQGTGAGWTEEIIGRWLAEEGGRRERIVLATKVFSRMGDGANDQGLSALHIRRACEDSLRRLQTDHIDLYQMHHLDRETPWEEIWQAMDRLISDGKILYVGTANFPGWQLATGPPAAAHRPLLGLRANRACTTSATERSSRKLFRPVVTTALDYSPGAHWRAGCSRDRLTRPTRGADPLRMCVSRRIT